MPREKKKLEALSETPGPEIQEDFLPGAELAQPDGAEGTAPDLPAEAPALPDTFTFKAAVEAVYKDTYVLMIVNGEKTASLEFDKEVVSFEGKGTFELEEGYTGIVCTIPYALAAEKHLPEFLEGTVVPGQAPAAAVQDEEDGQQANPYRKHLREEVITVT